MKTTINSIVLGLLFAMCLGMTACAGGGGSGSSVAVSPGTTPDYTDKAYVLRVMGGAPANHSVTVHMLCNQLATSGFRDETSNLVLANNQVGGAGCNQVYNVKFEVTNNSSYGLYYEAEVDGVVVDSGTIAGNQSYTFDHGYVQ